MLVANHHYECFSLILKHKASLGALLGVCVCSLTCISMTFGPTPMHIPLAGVGHAFGTATCYTK